MSSVNVRLPSPWGVQVLVVVVLAGAVAAASNSTPSRSQLNVYLPIKHMHSVLTGLNTSYTLSYKRWVKWLFVLV